MQAVTTLGTREPPAEDRSRRSDAGPRGVEGGDLKGMELVSKRKDVRDGQVRCEPAQSLRADAD